ncbi:acetate--CoA ligase [Alicyclobacillus acidoterrestris]|uniref:Acetyl-coenzyme A synthetase n=1 Tax=Alicyclobacillus acidoterrestris (strain ATCC 49025 / DSM 3922 / CIP 106132 / NCIMB 13137 / GD3B) TaxID=1356854 RepID=T0CX95_ALIAG|nr:acetate--CoA ligase [Alicyclobacillus acidoterrestris]EPZ43997.1 acetyl-CoA synthetase [Alicyclobacillus acidoterrestris ATCC 49025]UNO50552.1 acetate--CoA ligase [Alicyclobacillus acidoterrestris]
MSVDSQKLSTLMHENRTFPPSDEFRAQANFNDERIYEQAAQDPEAYWSEQALHLSWFKPFENVLKWTPPHAKWFLGGKLNAAYNCVDRHAFGPRKNKAALIWEGEPGDTRVLTYDMLRREVDKAAHALKRLGVQKGDRVSIYLPMIPELPIAMLAAAKIGAIHSVVFAGFSSQSLQQRLEDAKSKVLITADGGWRRGGITPLKANADEALVQTPVEKVVVVQRVGEVAGITMQENRDVYWHELLAESPTTPFEPEPMDSEDVLYLLYTSGTTGKPKGIVHSTGGYLTGANTSMRSVFDIKDSDVWFCTADIGWVTGHTYLVYGPLSAGTTVVMYEGGPDYPTRDRYWQIIEKYGVTVLYTAPTLIRTFMKWGESHPAAHDLSTLRLLGTVGEPINPEAWMWFHQHVGRGTCPIVDTWWQTETGCAMIAPLPGIVPTKPGSATRAVPGIDIDVVDENGESVGFENGGYLVIKKPWPSMLRTVWQDDARYRDTYFGKFEGVYLPGDGAHVDADGYVWILGRIDDVINVSGHRIGTAEVESALVAHPAVAEAAVIGRAHDVKGQAITAFVTVRDGITTDEQLVADLKRTVVEQIGAMARPEEIIFAAELPKTRSAKIMRRLLRDIAEGRVLGDTTTLADPSVVDTLKAQYKDAE